MTVNRRRLTWLRAHDRHKEAARDAYRLALQPLELFVTALAAGDAQEAARHAQTAAAGIADVARHAAAWAAVEDLHSLATEKEN